MKRSFHWLYYGDPGSSFGNNGLEENLVIPAVSNPVHVWRFEDQIKLRRSLLRS
jgi:hypothetical protein